MVKSYGKNRVRSNNIRTIRKAFPRFFSLMVMSFLGVFVFAGLTATAPDMIATLDRNLDRHNAYDIRIISDMGLDPSDVETVRAVDGVETAEAGHSLDVIASYGDNDCVINIASMPQQLNRIDLVDGRLPEQPDEIVTETNFLTKEGLSLGDTVTLDSESLTAQTVTIVGTVDSALYYNNVMISQSRGNTGIGSGTINYYAYSLDELFDMDYDTVIYVTVKGAADQVTSEDSYTALVDPVVDTLENLAPARAQVRLEAIRANAQQEIDDARADADEELRDARAELDDAEQTLADSAQELEDANNTLLNAWSELEYAQQQLNAAKKTLQEKRAQLDEAEASLADARAELDGKEADLDAAKQQLDIAETALSEGKAGLDAASAQLEAQKSAYQGALAGAGLSEDTLPAAVESAESAVAQLQGGIETLEASIAALNEQAAGLDPESAEYAELMAQISGLQAQEAELQAQLGVAQGQLNSLQDLQGAGAQIAAAEQALAAKQAEYNAGLSEYQGNLAAWQQAQTQINEAETEYAALKAEVDSGETAYADALAQYKSSSWQVQTGSSEYWINVGQYKEGLAEYEDGLQEYNDGLQEYNDAKAEADSEIADAEAELNDLSLPTWYVYDRTGTTSYNDYIDDSNSVRNLATIFPIVFFAVAVLVSLISMNRMVEEDRLEIGTMKSMGFPDGMILSKYLSFSLWATICGGLLGAASGLVVIPELIFYIYSILFTLPALSITLQPATTVLGFVLTVLCVCGTSVWTVYKVLKEKPAELLRPKAPKNGKRILLERIPWLWNRMKFSRKVTARNIFRYKKRVLVTIGGIAGCTALMLAGFGVKDAIVDVPSTQYYQIYQFDATAYVSDYGSDGIIADDFLQYDHVTSAVPAQRITADIEEINGFLQIVRDDADMKQIALFYDQNTGEQLHLETGKAIINEKLATMKHLQVGDTITLVDVDNRTMRVEIGGIAKNYIEHFVYLDEATYEAMGYSFEPNLVYLHTDSLDQAQKVALAADVLLNDSVLNFTYRSTLIDNVDNSLQSLNSVVLILIVLSALLAFVVLYNLSNININERKREIATLKVLGFYNKEVDDYITKENILLTAIGIVLGLLLGIVLSHAVVSTIEVEKCRFMNSLKPMSYVWSACMSAAFTWIVNVITHFNLKRINMIDSLKSVE